MYRICCCSSTYLCPSEITTQRGDEIAGQERNLRKTCVCESEYEQICAFLVLTVSILATSQRPICTPVLEPATRSIFHHSESRNLNHHCLGSNRVGLLSSLFRTGDRILAFHIIMINEMKPLPYLWAMVSYVGSMTRKSQQSERSLDIRNGDDVLSIFCSLLQSHPAQKQRQQDLSS